jgi:NAD-dependent deacetylase
MVDAIADLRDLIAHASRTVIFTGAGISTESGIPDFRSPGGIWTKNQPIQFQDFVASEARRREAWDRAFSGRAGWVGRAPNAGHMAVARLAARLARVEHALRPLRDRDDRGRPHAGRVTR